MTSEQRNEPPQERAGRLLLSPRGPVDAWRQAKRALGGEIRRTLLKRSQYLWLLAFFLFGFLMAWTLSLPLDGKGQADAAAPSEVVASYAVSLCVICLAISRLPSGTASLPVYWPHLCVWLTTVDLAIFSFLGIWVAPGGGLTLFEALALAAITSAYTALFLAIHALVCVLNGGPALWARAAASVVLAAAVTSLLWSKAPLQALQRKGGSGVVAYNVGTQAVAVFNPVMGVSAYWNADRTGFNLTKTPHIYQLWLGPSFISFPSIWPGRSGLVEEDRVPLGPGLVIGLILWGLVLMTAGDLAGAIRLTRRS